MPCQNLKSKVKVGIIGLNLGRIHLESCEKNDMAEVIAIVDLDQDKLNLYGQKYKINHCCSDYQELLQVSELDAVFVCLPNFLHAPASIEAFQRGLHVFCEKPLARNAEEAKKIVNAANRSGKKLMVGYNQRFREDTQFIRKMIKAGDVGEIYYLSTGWLRRQRTAKGWFTQKEKAGGGPLLDIGIHVLDLSLWLMDFPEPFSLKASTYNQFSSLDTEDFAAAFIKFKNGTTLFLNVCEEAHIKEEMIFLNILGTKAGVQLNSKEKPRIYTRKNNTFVDWVPQVGSDWQRSAADEVNHFLESIRKNEQPLATGEQAIMEMEIIDSIYKSAESGKEVTLT